MSIVLALSGLACAAAPLGFGIYRFVIESTARSMQVKIIEWFPVKPVDFFGVLFWGRPSRSAAGARCRPSGAANPALWAEWAVAAGASRCCRSRCAPCATRRRSSCWPARRDLPAGRRFPHRGPHRAPLQTKRPRAPSPEQPRLNLAILAAWRWPRRRCRGSPASNPRLAWRPISDGALAAARSCDGPLYNHYGDGGTLIWFLPEKPVFVDGRQDPYPLDFLLDVVDVEDGRSRTARFRSFPHHCAFLPIEPAP